MLSKAIIVGLHNSYPIGGASWLVQRYSEWHQAAAHIDSSPPSSTSDFDEDGPWWSDGRRIVRSRIVARRNNYEEPPKSHRQFRSARPYGEGGSALVGGGLKRSPPSGRRRFSTAAAQTQSEARRFLLRHRHEHAMSSRIAAGVQLVRPAQP
jgi:hypothetical protein